MMHWWQDIRSWWMQSSMKMKCIGRPYGERQNQIWEGMLHSHAGALRENCNQYTAADDALPAAAHHPSFSG